MEANQVYEQLSSCKAEYDMGQPDSTLEQLDDVVLFKMGLCADAASPERRQEQASITSRSLQDADQTK